MTVEIFEIISWIVAGFCLGILFMEVRMNLIGRMTLIEASLATMATSLAAGSVRAAEDIGKAIETVTVDAFDAIKAVVDGLVKDVADIKAAIGSDAPADATPALSEPQADPAPAVIDGGLPPASTETTGS